MSTLNQDVPLHLGNDRSGTHDPVDLKRLQLLALIEDEGPIIHMTALGKQKVERLGSRYNPARSAQR